MQRMWNTAGGIGILLVVLISLNVIGSRLHWRLDMTDGDLYTLSEGSRELVGKLEGNLELKFFFSKSSKALPLMVKNYAERVAEFLQQYASASGGRIRVEIVDPKPDSNEEEAARRLGIQAVRLPDGDEIYFGLAFQQGTIEAALPYLDPRREEFLEYDLSEAIYQVMNPKKRVLGLLSSFAMDGNPAQGGEAWAIIQQLRKTFDVKSLDPNNLDLQDLDTVLVIHPKNLSPVSLYRLDQFLVKGGRMFVALDPFSRTDLAMSQQQQMMGGQPPQAHSAMPELLAAWGLKMSEGKMVGDPQAAASIMVQGQRLEYPFFLNLQKIAFSQEEKITQSLNAVLLPEAGALEFAEVTGVTATSLMHTSETAGMVDTGMAMYLGPEQLARDLKKGDKPLHLAYLLQGKFSSAYRDKIPEGESPADFLAQGTADSSVVVIADVDFLADGNSVEVFRFAGQSIIRPRNDNLTFAMNAIEHLSGAAELMSIRAKGKLARPFTRVMGLQAQAQEKWKAEEEQLSAKLNELQAKINELQKQRTDGAQLLLTREQQNEIDKFRGEEAEVRKRRREVRKNLREDIERLGGQLTALNMLALPGLVSVAGVFLMLRRTRRGGQNKERSKP